MINMFKSPKMLIPHEVTQESLFGQQVLISSPYHNQWPSNEYLIHQKRIAAQITWAVHARQNRFRPYVSPIQKAITYYDSEDYSSALITLEGVIENPDSMGSQRISALSLAAKVHGKLENYDDEIIMLEKLEEEYFGRDDL